MGDTLLSNRLQAWINRQYPEVDRNQSYPPGLRQALFVRDQLAAVTCRGVDYEQYKDGVVYAISEHVSKSVTLPVYSIEPPGKDIRFVLRNNWYNWKVSVQSDKPIDIDDLGLFRATPPVAPDYEGNDLAACYFEGFPASLIFGYYSESDKKTFSAQLPPDECSMFTFVFLCMRSYERDLWQTIRTAEAEKTLQGALKMRRERAAGDVARLERELAEARKVAGVEV